MSSTSMTNIKLSELKNVDEMQESYENGKRVCRTWYNNGKILSHKVYHDDVLDGPHQEWYSNGQLFMDEFYHNGKLEGKRETWHDNGTLWLQETYHNGILDGKRKKWHSNGQLMDEFYQAGKLERDRKVWNNGILVEHVIYQDGKVMDHAKEISNKLSELLEIQKEMMKEIANLKSLLEKQ